LPKKIISDSQPINSQPLMNKKKSARCTLKD